MIISLLVMYELNSVRNKFTDEEIEVLLQKRLDYMIINWEKISDKRKFDLVLNLRDELDRWC